MNKLVLLLVVIISLSYPVLADSVTTNPATNIGISTVTINGHLTLTSPFAFVWFEYGGNSGNYIYRTAPQNLSATSDFSVALSGAPIMPRQSYFYHAVLGSADQSTITSTGSEQSFTLGSLTATDPKFNNFSKYTKNLTDARLNVTQMATILPKPYTDLMGSIFWSLVFGMIFVIIWIRQEDVLIPSIIGLLIGASIWGLMNKEYIQIAYSLLIVSLGGLVYSWMKSRS